jgi:DNA-binding XRE family transcriptional regulator
LAGRAGLGTARRGRVRQGGARYGEAWPGMARQTQGRQMTPEQVKALREKSGLSVAEAARCVQIADRSWQRYESGERKIPEGIVELFCLKNGLKYR